MRRRHVSRALALLLAVQLLLASVPGGLSLCIAADGHAAVELSHGAVPCLQDAQRHHPGARVEPDEFERHPCRDVSLLETKPYRNSDPVRPASTRGGAFIVLPEALSAPLMQLLPRRALLPPYADPVAQALRTVVLVI